MKLDLRLIIPGPTPATVLLDPKGALPCAQVEGDADEATVVAATAYLRDALAFAPPILETHPRWEGVANGEPIPTLVTTERAPAGWTPPDGLGFAVIPASLLDAPRALLPRALELLDELRTGAPPPDLRPRWSRPGWHARACAWMVTAAAHAGQPLVTEPEPFYLRGISALLRARTATGAVFLKAVFPPFHAEPAVTRLLAQRAPLSMPVVLAIEAEEGWLLVEEVGATLVGELPADRRGSALAAGAQAISELQRSVAGDLDAFAAAGCPRRPLADMPGQLDTALGTDGVAIADNAVTTERRERAVAATLRAVERVAGLGFPTSVVHGDLHAGNAFLVGERIVIIDWSDAAIGDPLVDLVTWLSWSRDEPDQQRVATDAWIDAWAGSTDPVAVRDAIGDILLVGAAYQVISYDGILRGLEPATRYTLADGAVEYFNRLEGLIRES